MKYRRNYLRPPTDYPSGMERTLRELLSSSEWESGQEASETEVPETQLQNHPGRAVRRRLRYLRAIGRFVCATLVAVDHI